MNSFNEVLAQRGVLFYNTVGDSMKPLVKQGRDLVIIVAKPKHPLHRGDVPLYQRPSGQYVLHRIVRSPRFVPGKELCYCCCGDNRTELEHDVLDSYVIGVLQAVVRKGKRIEVDNIWYRIYWHYVIYTRLLRIVNHYIKKVRRHVFRNS